MAYEKKISRANPALVVFVLDDSGSMGDPLHGTTDEKFNWVERYSGIILKELLSRSTEVRGQDVVVKPRYYVHTIQYGSRPQIWGSECMDIEAVVTKYAEEGNSLGLGGKLGGTDAAAALAMAHDFLRQAVALPTFQASFPPMVFHLTDGMSATDAALGATGSWPGSRRALTNGWRQERMKMAGEQHAAVVGCPRHDPARRH